MHPEVDAHPPPPELTRLVEREAWEVRRRHPRTDLSLDDLVGYGHVGLLEAWRRYDPRRGINLEAYVLHRIRGAMFDGLRASGALRRRGFESLRREAMTQEAIDPPGGTAEDAQAIARAIVRAATAVLVDATRSRSEEPTPDAEAQLAAASDVARLRSAVDALPADEREVIRATYDLGEAGDSGAALARRRGVHRSQISRVHRRALDRLRLAFETIP